jgi:hypothetical protein
MTPRELQLHVDEYRERIKREREMAIVQAYHTALFYRAKRLPSLEAVLERINRQFEERRPKRDQTPEEMFAFMMQFAQQYQGEEG